jgi:hypothetical protein
VIIFFIRRDIPESPRYLLVNGHPDRAREVLARVAQENGSYMPPHPDPQIGEDRCRKNQ